MKEGKKKGHKKWNRSQGTEFPQPQCAPLLLLLEQQLHFLGCNVPENQMLKQKRKNKITLFNIIQVRKI